MTPTFKIFLRSDYIKKDGTYPIYLRLTIKRKSKSISLDISCLKKHWNFSKSRLKRSAPDSYRNNILLDKFEAKARTIIFNYQKEDKILTFNEFAQHFNNDNYNNNSFITFVQDQIKLYTGQFAKGTIKGYNDQLNKLMTYRQILCFLISQIRLWPDTSDIYL